MQFFFVLGFSEEVLSEINKIKPSSMVEAVLNKNADLYLGPYDWQVQKYRMLKLPSTLRCVFFYPLLSSISCFSLLSFPVSG